MEFERKEFKKKFPHLYGELEEVEDKDSSGLGADAPEVDLPKGCMSEVVSYIRRARDNDEAREIINYLRKRGEVSDHEAKDLVRQIEEKGVRSFGSLKTWGHYEREFRKKPLQDYANKNEHT